MSKAAALIAAAIVACAPWPACGKANAPASGSEIRRTLNAYAKGHQRALVAVGMISAGKTRTYFARGSKETSVGLNDRTLFEIGSITKTFTATLLAQMVESGAVRLNDPIQKYLPHGIVAPTYKGVPITLASLAEHRSGLPANPPNLPSKNQFNPFAGYTLGMLYAGLAHYKLTRAPGAAYEYSNFAFGLLGQLLAERAHRPWSELVDRRILRPLGMNDTVVIASAQTSDRLAPAFLYDGQPQGPWDFGAVSPAGSIESDLHDMLVYLKANMNAPAGPLGHAMSFAQQPRTPEDKQDVVGLAWETSLRHGFVSKAGGTGGYSALIVFDRRAHYGMVFLANAANYGDLTQLAGHIIMPASEGAPTEWALIKRERSPYSGRYPIASNGPHFALTVFKYSGRLYVETNQSSPEQLVKLRLGRYSWKSTGAIITFDRDAKGRVTGLTALQNGHITRTRKQP